MLKPIYKFNFDKLRVARRFIFSSGNKIDRIILLHVRLSEHQEIKFGLYFVHNFYYRLLIFCFLIVFVVLDYNNSILNVHHRQFVVGRLFSKTNFTLWTYYQRLNPKYNFISMNSNYPPSDERLNE